MGWGLGLDEFRFSERLCCLVGEEDGYTPCSAGGRWVDVCSPSADLVPRVHDFLYCVLGVYFCLLYECNVKPSRVDFFQFPPNSFI